VKKITDDMKIKAAENLANAVVNPTPEKIIPSPFEE
jgi:malic enzyme